MTEAVLTSETSVYFNETTRPHIPEGSHLDIIYYFISLYIIHRQDLINHVVAYVYEKLCVL
jgi:hypothetical protein